MYFLAHLADTSGNLIFCNWTNFSNIAQSHIEFSEIISRIIFSAKIPKSKSNLYAFRELVALFGLDQKLASCAVGGAVRIDRLGIVNDNV